MGGFAGSVQEHRYSVFAALVIEKSMSARLEAKVTDQAEPCSSPVL